MKPHYRIPCFAALGGLVIVTASAAWLFAQREPVLLDRARFITSTKEMGGGKRFHYGLSTHWLTDNDIVFSRLEGPRHDDRIIYRRNVTTGAETRLQGLTDNRDAHECEVVDDEEVSPDGRWYVCSARWSSCFLAEVNGRKYYDFPSADTGGYRGMFWSPDSCYWLEWYGSGVGCTRLILHDIRMPAASNSIEVGSSSALFGDLRAIVSANEAVIVEDGEPPSALDGYPIDDENTRHLITIERVTLAPPARILARHNVVVPAHSSQYDLKISPDGKRIAWEVRSNLDRPMNAWLHRLLPFLHQADPPLHVSVWVSNIDGTDMHEIGGMSRKPQEADDDSIYLNVKWLPGGKQLSFEYEDKLYTVGI